MPISARPLPTQDTATPDPALAMLRLLMQRCRAKALGGHAEGQLAAMVARSKVSEHDGHASDKDMIAAMVSAHDILAATLAGTAAIAEEHGDLLTQDMAIERGQMHEKFAWLLRAHLG